MWRPGYSLCWGFLEAFSLSFDFDIIVVFHPMDGMNTLEKRLVLEEYELWMGDMFHLSSIPPFVQEVKK